MVRQSEHEVDAHVLSCLAQLSLFSGGRRSGLSSLSEDVNPAAILLQQLRALSSLVRKTPPFAQE